MNRPKFVEGRVVILWKNPHLRNSSWNEVREQIPSGGGGVCQWSIFPLQRSQKGLVGRGRSLLLPPDPFAARFAVPSSREAGHKWCCGRSIGGEVERGGEPADFGGGGAPFHPPLVSSCYALGGIMPSF